MTTSLEEVGQALRGLKSAIIAAHVSPDADAIGSSAAMALALAGLGIETHLYNVDEIPSRFFPLLRGLEFSQNIPEEEYSALVVLDTATRKRVGREVSRLQNRVSKVINIDHHVSNDSWGDLNFIDSVSPSTTAIVGRLLRSMEVEVSPQMANLLYAGLIDDTGCFRFSNTNTSAFEAGLHLLEAGASPVEVSSVLYFSMPERVLRLRAKALSSIEVALGGKVALVAITLADLQECRASADDTEGIIDDVRSLEGLDCAIFMRETKKSWKLSLRSNHPGLDVSEVAKVFDGGGHKAAAGCMIRGTKESVEKKVLDVLKKELKRQETSPA